MIVTKVVPIKPGQAPIKPGQVPKNPGQALKEVARLRAKFLAEIDNQFIYDKCHVYGWADTWLLTKDGSTAEYGAVWGKDKREDRFAAEL
jgi:hypothetical protein